MFRFSMEECTLIIVHLIKVLEINAEIRAEMLAI